MRKFGVGRVARLVALIVLALLIAACGSSGGNPTAESPTEAPPSPTATLAPEIPPTWTPSAAPDSAAESDQAGAALPRPATWTPRVPDTPTAAPTVMGPTQTPRPTRTPLPDWCNALVAIEAPDASITGHPVNLRWAALENAERYRVELRNSSGFVLAAGIVESAEYNFPGDLFAMPGVYGWEVEPLDQDGGPLCFTISDEIVVRVPPE